MKVKKFTLGLLAALTLGCSSLFAQDNRATLSGGADFVSSYVWRGAYQTGASIQPYAELGVGGFAVGVWGNTALEASAFTKEFDYYVSYGVGGFSATVTDYWWSGEKAYSAVVDDMVAPSFFKHGHYYELALGYTFSEDFPLSLSVSTMFAGADKDAKGDQLYSTYIGVDYPFTVGEVGFDVGVGVTPSAGMYADDFNVCSASLRVSKSIAITDKFELPLFVDAIANPAADNAYLLAGFSLSF